MKKHGVVVLCCVLVAQLLLGTTVFGAEVNGKYISSSGACVMDYETGEILYSYQGNIPRVPASMTKIMNLYCVYEALARGEIALDTVVPISRNVYEKSRNSIYQSVLPLYQNQTYTVDEMIGVVVTYSASGAAVALAELVGGSEWAFVERMNQKAAAMGINAYYYDSCGIAENQISPIGMATLARNIIKDYPDILKRSAKPSVWFHGNTYKSTNKLLSTYYYAGADGLKTGTTSAAGYCFCGTAVRNGRRMISVTMNSSSTGQRFVDTARLLDYGFSVADAKYDSICYTNMRVFVNRCEMPAFSYRGTNPHAVIIAEDLKDYGFDVSWNSETKTLTAVYQSDKPITPIPMDEYRNKNGQKAFSVCHDDVSVVLDDGVQQHVLNDVYRVNGYICISVDELSNIYDFSWNNDELSAYIKTYPKQEKAVLPNGETLTSASAYIMDYNTGEALYAFHENEQRPIASIAKMMAVYVALDAVRNGEVRLDSIVPISENVYRLSRVEDYKMMVNLDYDETYTLDEMLDMIVIDSAAACVTAVAELIAGSEAEFVVRMNEKAEEIGIQSVFYNGTGVVLDAEYGQENLMSAREVAVMTRCMIQDYPEILERTKCASVDFHGKTYYNLNKMFTDYYYRGADGFKNGMTNASGYCMCGTAMLNGKRIISVTLPSSSNETRFTDTAKMFDYGFMQLGVDTQNVSEDDNRILAEGMQVSVNIDGNYEMQFQNQRAVVQDNCIFIPIRELFETLGKTVKWDGLANTVTVFDETTSVCLTIGDTKLVKQITNPLDGTQSTEEGNLEAAPILINGTACVPINKIAEAFGAAVIWESDTQTVLIIAGVC